MKKLTEGNIWKNFILFAIPLVLSGLLSQAYNLIDTMIAGHYLGEAGLAAVGATSSAITFVSSLFWGYMVGFGMYVARLFGEGAYGSIRRGVWMHFAFCSVIALLFTLVALVFADPFLHLLKVEDAIFAEAKRYFVIYMLGFALILLNTNATFLLGSLGDSSFPFWMSIVSAVLNVGGNILSITVLDWGVAGIAAATVFSATVVSVFYIFRFLSIFRSLLPEGSDEKWDLTETRLALPYSLPPILQQGTMYVAGLLLSPMINSLGSAAIASYVVSMQILTFVNATYQNASRTVSNYAAQCIGSLCPNAEKRQRLSLGVRVGAVQSMAFTVIPVLLCLIFPQFVASIFFAEGTVGESISLSVTFERVFLPFVLFNVINNLIHSFLRAVRSMKLLVTTTVLSSAVRILVSFPLTASYGLNGFWTGMVIAWAAEAIFLLILYRLRVWMPSELKS